MGVAVHQQYRPAKGHRVRAQRGDDSGEAVGVPGIFIRAGYVGLREEYDPQLVLRGSFGKHLLQPG